MSWFEGCGKKENVSGISSFPRSIKNITCRWGYFEITGCVRSRTGVDRKAEKQKRRECLEVWKFSSRSSLKRIIRRRHV